MEHGASGRTGEVGLRIARTAVAAAWLLTAGAAHAADLSLVGQLDPNNPQDAFLHTFTLTAPGTVTIQSWGFGGSAGAPGGVNAAGNPIAAGGFDPYVSLFAGSGASATFLLSNDDGSCPPGTVADLLCGDSTLTLPLAAGTYTLAVSAFLNMSFAENLGTGTLGDGFIGLGSFGTRTNAYAVDITGASVVLPTQLLSYVPNGLTFGPQTVGLASGPLSVTVTNTGSGNVAMGALSVGGTNAGDFAAATSCAGTLAPGASCSVSVGFTPGAVGDRSASVTLASSASNAPIVFAVGGTGTTDPVAVASLSVANLAFGAREVGTSTTLPLTVTNTGGAALSIASVTLAGLHAGDFVLADACGGATLPPAASCLLSVTFTPSALGPRSAALTIVSDASNSPASVAITGEGAHFARVTPVPTLSSVALALLAALLAGIGLRARPLRNTNGVARRATHGEPRWPPKQGARR